MHPYLIMVIVAFGVFGVVLFSVSIWSNLKRAPEAPVRRPAPVVRLGSQASRSMSQ